MIRITLIDGKVLQFPQGIDGMEIAKSIGMSFAKGVLAMEVNGKVCDLSTQLETDAVIKFITVNDEKGLEIIRHDTAHVLAQAVKELYPEAQITIGPVIKDGFYYDFAHEKSFSTDDLSKIESRMHEIVRKNSGFIRKIVSHDEAISIFKEIGENYKIEIIDALPSDEPISVYYQGEFFDLCRGPHGSSMQHIKAFKLMKVSGAYWRGDNTKPMLQRIYGTAWATEEQLKSYLHCLEEAVKRDHRVLGKEMDLFHFQDDAPGTVFWHHKGWQMFQILVNFIRDRQNSQGYIEVNTPELLDRSIWETSGHWEKFKENMFVAHAMDEGREYAIKPMSCPGAVQIYNHGITSYRDLPIRMAEFGKVHRFEPSGALHGLMRVRGFTQDDAHIFCTEDQIHEESLKACDFAMSVYKACGFDDVILKISDRPEKRIGSDDVWDKAEAALIMAAEGINMHYEINKGEGAFYGPKIEFTLRDAIGRDWQIGTLQVDFNLPQRFNAVYTGVDGAKRHPIMLHRAILGSIERFIGIMLEHYAGNVPLWLAPTQVIVVAISGEQVPYAKQVCEELLKANIRAEVDVDNQTLSYKLRRHIIAKTPLVGVVGNNEVRDDTITVRKLGHNSQDVMSTSELISMIRNQ